MFDRIDPKLLPYLDSGARQSLQSGALSVDDHQALLGEAKRKHDFVDASIPKPTLDDLRRNAHPGDSLPRLDAGDAQLRAALEREWYERHRAEAIRKGNETGWRDLPADSPTAPDTNDSSTSTRYEPPFSSLSRFEQNRQRSEREQFKKNLKDLAIPDRPAEHGEAPKPDDLIRMASDEDVAKWEGERETFAKHQRDQQRLAKLDADTPEWVDKPGTIHLSLEEEGVFEFSPGPPEDEDGPPYDNPRPHHPITPETRKKIEDQGRWGTDWPPKNDPQLPPSEQQEKPANTITGNPQLRWDTNTLSWVPWDGSVTIREDASRTPTEARPIKTSKFTRFLESPLFLGGVGVVVAILALAFWGALFILAAVLFMAAIIRADLFEHSPKGRKTLYNIVACAGVALGTYAFWYFVPNPFIKASVPPASAPSRESSTQSVSKGQDRSFVDVDAAYLVGLYQKYNSVQADEAVKTYIGKWIRISGSVTDVDRPKHLQTSDTVRVSVFVEKEGSSSFIVLADFNDARGMDRALILNKREKIMIEGQIDQILPPGITLHDCKIVE